MARNPVAPRRGAKKNRPGWFTYLLGWGDNHLEALHFSAGKFRQTPISSLMTCLVISIALALPAALTMLLSNVQSISNNWDIAGNITLYLEAGVDDTNGVNLARELRDHPAIESTRFIGRDEALATFRVLSGFGEVLDSLDENPLPAAIVLSLHAESTSPDQLQQLAMQLQQHSEVETAQVDLEWIQRFNAIIDLLQRVVLVIGGLLGVAVLLTIGNTIRLDIHNRREEIVVIKLIGATNAFVRRPFLYGGLLYGFFGGVLSALLVITGLRFLDTPANYLAALYGSAFELVEIDGGIVLLLITISTLLGLVGSWLSVGRHLREIEPK